MAELWISLADVYCRFSMCAACLSSVGENKHSVKFREATWCSRRNLGLGVGRPGFNPGCHSVALWLGASCLTFMSLSCSSVKLEEVKLYDFNKFCSTLTLYNQF